MNEVTEKRTRVLLNAVDYLLKGYDLEITCNDKYEFGEDEDKVMDNFYTDLVKMTEMILASSDETIANLAQCESREEISEQLYKVYGINLQK